MMRVKAEAARLGSVVGDDGRRGGRVQEFCWGRLVEYSGGVMERNPHSHAPAVARGKCRKSLGGRPAGDSCIGRSLRLDPRSNTPGDKEFELENAMALEKRGRDVTCY